MNRSHLKPFFSSFFITDTAYKIHFTPFCLKSVHTHKTPRAIMQECTECFVCMLINRRPCTFSDSRKTLDNIVCNLIIFVDAITELNYFGLDMMCTLKFPACKSHHI